MSTNNSSIDQILDLLIDALEERRAVRSAEPSTHSVINNIITDELIAEVEAPVEVAPAVEAVELEQLEAIDLDEEYSAEYSAEVLDEEYLEELDDEELDLDSSSETDDELESGLSINEAEIELEESLSAETDAITEPVFQESVNLNRMLAQLAIVLAIVIGIINIPLGIDSLGSTLATAMPDSESAITFTSWNGMLLQASGQKVYLLEDGNLRWITTKEIFQERGYRWGDINKVSQEQLDEFPLGTPILRTNHNASDPVVTKCAGSPHIYVVDGATKRWVRDIQTFSAEGYIWSDVVFMNCAALRKIPDGETIPPGSGVPPSP